MKKSKKKFKHGEYYYETEKGFYLFSTYKKRGRAFLNSGAVKDFSYKTHPKAVLRILKRGERIITSSRELS